MTDREKAIKGLQIERECVSRDCDRYCGKCDLAQDRDWLLSVYDDAIDMLKEQRDVVLCKNCKFYTDPQICPVFGMDRYDAWFCAAGKRR